MYTSLSPTAWNEEQLFKEGLIKKKKNNENSPTKSNIVISNCNYTGCDTELI